jgi:U2 small nuclear ribonucleoprotein A'
MLTALQNYRYWVLWQCRALRFLDFQKVKEAEREKADELFGTFDEPTPLARKVCTTLYLCTLHLTNKSVDSLY